MKIEIKGQVFPKVWDIAYSVKKLREERSLVNIGGGTMGMSVYEVTLPDSTERDGAYLVTPQGIRLFYNRYTQYEVGYLISELDDDPLAKRHFNGSNA